MSPAAIAGAVDTVAAEERGPADLDAAIRDLQHRLRELCRYIDRRMNHPDAAPLDAKTYAHLAGLQGELSSRLGRLMRDRQQLAGDAADDLAAAIDAALDEVGEQWEIEL